MRSFDIDENNDLYRGADGNISMVFNVDAASTVSRNFAQTIRGEMIYDVQSGVPFWPTAFGANPNLNQFEAALRRRLLQVPNIFEVASIEFSQNNDVLSYSANIRTIFGVAQINGRL